MLAKDDLVKGPWKSDDRKCQNQVTSTYFDNLSKSRQPLFGPTLLFGTDICVGVSSWFQTPTEQRNWA